MALSNLGSRLSGVGRREDALAPAEEAVTIRRRLAETNPAAYLPNLAQSLWSIGWICDVGSFDDAAGIAATEEAVALFAVLARSQPAAYSEYQAAAAATLARLRGGTA